MKINWTRRNKLFGTVMTINGKQYDIKPGADLVDANLSLADLRGANLTGAYFQGTTMPDGSIRNH